MAAVVCALWAPVVSAQSAADRETARELLTRGQELRESGDLAAALRALTQAHALATTPITTFELARTHAQARHYVQARELALSVARIAPGAKESEQAHAARTEAAELAEQLHAKIATLNVTLQGVPAGREVVLTVDGTPIASAAVGAPLRLDPGAHAVAARVGKGPESRADVTLAEGETKPIIVAVTVVDEPPPVLDAKTDAAATGTSTLSPAADSAGTSAVVWLGFGTAVVGLGVGTVTGLLAISRAGTSECDGTRCTGAGLSDIDTGRSLALVSTISMAVAVAGACVGIYGLTWGAPRRAGLRVLPSLAGASLAGTF
jgi:hypothetical protein